jgi:hypothetical protein
MRKTLLAASAVTTIAALGLAGCTSYAKDLKVICEAPDRVQGADPDPAMRAVQLAEYISQNLGSKDGRATFSAIANMNPRDKATLLRDEARAQGLSRCAFADLMDSYAAGEPEAEAPAIR